MMGKEDQGSEVRGTTRLIHRHHGAIAVILVVLAASVTTAQQNDRSTTETLPTLRNQDPNGAVAVSEQAVTQRTRDDGDQVVIETYSPSMDGGRLALSRRVRRTTTATNNGSQTVEETEERNPAAPGEPLRTVRRSVTTVRRSGADSYVSERQVFELDANGRLVTVRTETERAFRQ